MKIITGSTGTAHVTSNDAGEFHQIILGNDNLVSDMGNHLQAAIVDNNTVRISDGSLVMQGRHALIEAGSTEDVTIETGSIGLNRHDLIVARYALDSSTGHESITLQVIRGTEASGTAVDPTYNTGNIRLGATLVDFPLYRVSIEGITIDEVTPLFSTSRPVASQMEDFKNAPLFTGNIDSAPLGLCRMNAGAVSWASSFPVIVITIQANVCKWQYACVYGEGENGGLHRYRLFDGTSWADYWRVLPTNVSANLTDPSNSKALAASQGKVLDEKKLDKTGGTVGPLTVENASSGILSIRRNGTGLAGMVFYNNSTQIGAFGFDQNKTPTLVVPEVGNFEVLHTGNSARVAIQSSQPSGDNILWVK